MKKTFQSFVFGCRVNEAERMKIDRQLAVAGFSVDLVSPAFLIINTCAITGKAEREAKQLVYQLRKKHPQAQIVLTGCSSTLWDKYQTGESKIADIIVPNASKTSLVSLLHTSEVRRPKPLTTSLDTITEGDKFRYSNRLLVKIQDGCHRFCSYCIVPYLRGLPQSERIKDIISYINSFSPVPSEVVLSAINTEAFGKDTGETLDKLVKTVLSETQVPRIAFGSIHPWSLTDEFLKYYKTSLIHEKRFIHFFHVPVQSGSQTMLGLMKREYSITDVVRRLKLIKKLNPRALIATDVIVGFLGETKELFEKTYSLLEKSPISRFHVFRFSNRPHTAAFYLKKQYAEPTEKEKKDRSNRLIALSKEKYQQFIETQIGTSCDALVIANVSSSFWGGVKRRLQNQITDSGRLRPGRIARMTGIRVLLGNQVEGILLSKHCLPGTLVRVTIIAVKEGIAVCKES